MIRDSLGWMLVNILKVHIVSEHHTTLFVIVDNCFYFVFKTNNKKAMKLQNPFYTRPPTLPNIIPMIWFSFEKTFDHQPELTGIINWAAKCFCWGGKNLDMVVQKTNQKYNLKNTLYTKKRFRKVDLPLRNIFVMYDF